MTESNQSPENQRSRVSSFESSQKAAAAEREAAKHMDLRNQFFTLAAAVVFFVAYLVLPHAGPARGYDFVFHTATGQQVGISLPETIFCLLMSVGVGVLTTAVLITKRAVFGLAAWMMVTVGFVSSIFVFWVRGSQSYGAEVGVWLGIFSMALATVAYSLVALRRSPQQLEAERRARAAAGQLDEVGHAQRQAQTKPVAETNPLFIDDRRAQAAQRHRRNQES